MALTVLSDKSYNNSRSMESFDLDSSEDKQTLTMIYSQVQENVKNEEYWFLNLKDVEFDRALATTLSKLHMVYK